MTREEDIWACYECGDLQGRHDLWFDGDICEKCNTFKQEVEADKIFRTYMKKQILEEAQRNHSGKF